jgi:para-aminobenzoate synthetase component 2
MPDPFVAGRYHSLVVDESSLPDCFEVTATSGRLIMGMRHRDVPLEGVQFHPESVLTQEGYLVLANWLSACGIEVDANNVAQLNARSTDVRSALPIPTL